MANKKKEFTGVNVVTPVCRLAFPAIFEKKPDFNGKLVYSVVMVFEKSIDLSVLKKAMIQAARNEFGNDVDLSSLDMKRIKDGDLKDREEFKNSFTVNAKTTLKAPGVVDAQCQKIIDPSEIYSGVYANVALTAKGYRGPSGNGVTFYLNHIQKVKDGEPFAGGPSTSDVFEELNIEEPAMEAESMGTEEDMFT